MTSARNITAEGADFIDRMLSGSAWNSTTITYGFTTSSSQYSAGYGSNEDNVGYQSLTTIQQAAFVQAISAWADLININIVQAAGGTADIRAAQSSQPTTAWGYNPSNASEGGDVWIGTGAGYYATPKLGNYAYDTFMHELGHTLGLAHPSDENLAGTPIAAAAALSPAQMTQAFGGNASASGVDAMAYSLMSYSSYSGDGAHGYTNATWDYAQSPMLRDISAVQYMYGANYNTRAGDTVYSWNPATGEKLINGVAQGAPGGDKVFETLWDGGGHDTLDLSAYRTDLKIDLQPGAWSTFDATQLAHLGAGQTAPGNVAMSYLYQGNDQSLIENAVGGSGNDTIVGNAGNNLLIGGKGDDTLQGLDGHNILAGGSIGGELGFVGIKIGDWISENLTDITNDGNDTLIGGSGNDIFLPGDGTNQVRSNGGIDTLILNVAHDAISIVQQGASYLLSYAGGSTVESGISYLATTDGIFSFGGQTVADAASASQQQAIHLLYEATFGRDVDTAGLTYWSDAMTKGTTLQQIAPTLINSTEFAQHYSDPSTLSDSDFVNLLYQNVMHRQGDAAGIDYWVGQFANGESRSDALIAFATSGELDAATPHGAQADASIHLVAVSQADWAQHWA